MSKILYFEGAGWEDADISKRTIGNCRIRTAFTNNEGRKIYLEMSAYEKSNNDNKIGRHSEYQVGEAIGFVDFCFYIDTESKDPCNECGIRDIEYNIKIAYTKEAITEMINKKLNCNFDTIEVLHNMEGYRVHADNNKYNLMDNHIINRARTEARIKAYNEIDMYFRKRLYSKYSEISLMNKNDDSITVRCHASKEQLQSAGMGEWEREKTIAVNY